jgi:hypothetical protein
MAVLATPTELERLAEERDALVVCQRGEISLRARAKQVSRHR